MIYSCVMMSARKIIIFACWLASCQADGDQAGVFRLEGGAGKYEGTVEYLAPGEDQYGVICDDFWDIRDANVVCRELGFPNAEVAWKYSHFGSSQLPIIYDDVECKGSEENIAPCSKSEKWQHDCSLLELAGVTCKRVSGYPPNLIQVYYNDSWKLVTSEKGSWGLAEATVYCRSVDFMIATDLLRDDTSFPAKPISLEKMVSITCTGEEEDLSQCKIRSYSLTEELDWDAIHLSKAQCLSAKLSGGRSVNEGVLIINTFDDSNDVTGLRTISEEGARVLCMKMGFADVAHILTDATFMYPNNVNVEMVVDMVCDDEEHDWWECEKVTMNRYDFSEVEEMMDPAIGLVCKPYYSVASDTSYNHWSMERDLDPIPTQHPTQSSVVSVSRPFLLSRVTTTTTRAPLGASAHSGVRRSSAITLRGCTLEGSYDSLTVDDIRLADCDVIQDERGPVGRAISSSSAASTLLTFHNLALFTENSARVFCAGNQCRDGFALAYWFTLPPCTNPKLGVKIDNKEQSCFFLEAQSRIRIKADKDNDDGQITMSTVACSKTGDTKQTCSSETLYSQSFTSTPFETGTDPENGCGYLVWNHVALNVHLSESPMTCELFINGHPEEFSCEPLQKCLSSVRYGLSLVSRLGPNTGLDEVGLWRRPLDDTEVMSLYHQPTDLPETFTEIPLWVVPLAGRTHNCPCEEATAMDLMEQIEDEDAVTPTDLLQITELLTTVTNMTDFTLISDRKEKHEAIQSSLDVISSVTKLSAKKAQESMDDSVDFHEVGHNILGSLEALQNALLNDVTIFNKFTSDEIEITTAPTVGGTDFIYRRDQTGANDDGTTVRISSKNFKTVSRVSVALLKGSAASFLPKKLTRKNKTPLKSNVTSPVLNVQTTGINEKALEENITFTIPHNPNTMKQKKASFVCSFYEPDSKSFSNEGCIRVSHESDDQSTTCSCNHMTSFAILMAFTDVSISRANEFALDVITYIGCGLSIIALIFSLIVLGVSRLKSIRIRILMNQCIAMLLAQSLFISLVENASVNMVACKVVAAFLHLFFLAVIFWMFVQGVYMYTKTTMLHKAVIPLKYFLLVGWGVPVVIVGATAAVNIDFYGMEGICWLNRDNGGIWIFVVPALIIALMNSVVMGLTVRALRSVKVFQNKTDKEKIKSTFKATVVLLPILGCTWGTGILVNASVIFSYLFAICNAFQGLCLFIMQILINAEIRSALRLRKSRILPFNTSSVGESTAMSNNADRSKAVTKSTNHTTRTGVEVHSISGNGPSVVGEPLPAAQ